MTDVSAIISVYNTPDLAGKVANLLATTLAQQERLELVFVDSATKNAADKVAMAEAAFNYPHVVVKTMPHRIPIYQAWNIGITQASSPWVVNSNSDDWVTTTAYEDMLLAGADADVVYGNWHCVTNMKTKAPFLEQGFYPLGVSYFANYPFRVGRLAQFCHWSCGVMWRKSLHGKAGLFDPSFMIAGDYDMWCRFVLNGARVVAFPEYLGWWYFDPDKGNISFADTNQYAFESRRIRMNHFLMLMALDTVKENESD